jgi:ribonucleoside-triphosphate reductase
MRRVKTIFSVIASPSRLEILKILNSKGSMSYSELKQHAGFRSKKESGKFAYHLRKLLRQNLIILNRAERKYMLTSLGRLVLTAAKQIEEQAMIESGRLYVRTSSEKMEEFDPSKITQSLVKEAGVPLEIAQRIANEVESRIYKFQTSFLTAPLIRELVNSILIEQGQEQYWRMLRRVGMPVYDVAEILEKIGTSPKSQEDIMYYTAGKLFLEYLIQSKLPPDVADAHLNGDIHIAWTNSWELKPEAVIVDVSAFDSIDLGLKFQNLSRDKEGLLYKLVYTLSREVSTEIYLKNFMSAIDPEEDFLHVLKHISLSMPSYYGAPKLTLEFKDVDKRLIGDFLRFSENTPNPSISLAIPKDFDEIGPLIDGGNPILLANDMKVTSNGLFYDVRKPLNIVLYGASINLPRMAIDSHGDEVYFRAKIVMSLDTVANALTYRMRSMTMHIKSGLLPGINSLLEREPHAYMRTIVNLTGLEEAMNMLTTEPGEKMELKRKVIETTKEHMNEKVDKEVFISVVPDDGGKRLAQLDLERKGKGRIRAVKGGYSQGYSININTSNEVIEEIVELSKVLDGGIYVELKTTGKRINALMEKAKPLTYYRMMTELVACNKCGWSNPLHLGRCRHCGGPLMPTR